MGFLKILLIVNSNISVQLSFDFLAQIRTPGSDPKYTNRLVSKESV